MSPTEIGIVLKRFESPDETREVGDEAYVSPRFTGADHYAK